METNQTIEVKVIPEKREVTDEMIIKYKKMVESFLKKSVVKNWNEANISINKDEVGLGNSGWSMADMRQYLTTEVFIALRNYDSKYKTKESTFVYGHLSKRAGSLMEYVAKA